MANFTQEDDPAEAYRKKLLQQQQGQQGLGDDAAAPLDTAPTAPLGGVEPNQPPLSSTLTPAPLDAAPAAPRTYAETPGFVTSKLNDPAHRSTKYDFMRMVQEASGGKTAEQWRGGLEPLVAGYNERYGQNARVAGEDLIDFGGAGGAGIKDVINGNDGDWHYIDPGQGSPTGTPAGAQTLTGPQSTQPAALPPTSPTNSAQTPFGGVEQPFTGGPQSAAPAAQSPATGQSPAQTPQFLAEIRKMLMDRIAAAQQPIDQNDPSIALPLSAARDEATRTSEGERKALAERSYADGTLGTTPGLIDQQIQQSAERNAIGLGGVRSTLIANQMEAKRSDLQQALSLALASGDSEAVRMAQSELQALDAQLRREGYDVSRRGQDMGAASTRYGQDLNAELSREGMGLDAAKYRAYLDQLAVSMGIGA